MIDYALDEDFHRGGRGTVRIRNIDRQSHGTQLLRELDAAFASAEAGRSQITLSADDLGATGTVLVLEGGNAIYPLRLESLNSLSRHTVQPKKPRWLLLAVHVATPTQPERAVVWVSDEYRAQFLKLFEDFLARSSTRASEDQWTTPEGNPANQALVANISRIRTAILADLWTSDGDPPRGRNWWELWLGSGEGGLASLRQFAENYGLRYSERSVAIRDRVVVWVEATWTELEMLPFTNVPLAEIRRPEFIDTIEDLSASEQDELVSDLAERVTAAGDHAPAVCLLDTGVFRAHVLLRDSLSQADHQTIVGFSGNDVHVRGHGTSMAGLALLGPLDEALLSAESVQLRHRLESVRLMPSATEPLLDPLDFGSGTAEAVALAEIASSRGRVFSLTLSTPPDKPGEPTLWSASVDALAVGTEVVRDGDQLQLLSRPDPESARLIVVAAGNVDSYQTDFRTESDTSAVQDPAQSWNALTVGAYTNLVGSPDDPQYDGWASLAGQGELSPHSRTSVMFNQRAWPIKPDICMEGGNVLSDGGRGFEDRHPLVSLRSTGSSSDIALTSANATSAATAQAARLAAIAMDRYPEYWPETIRALLVHGAEWTPAMTREIDAAARKQDRLQLLRRYGWGVPSESAVLASTQQAVTLVTQDQFTPFEGEDYRMRSFRLHGLPWPAETLDEIGSGSVRLRITLSYFIEPTASRRGWKRRYGYASHGLRFDLQGPLETQREFVARVNRDAQTDEDGATRTVTTTDRWVVGPNQRNLGSIHQDEWLCTGAELARCNSVAVYPVGGWWKNNNRSDRLDSPIRYALLLSLRTEEQGIDLYTPIANQLRVPVATEIATS